MIPAAAPAPVARETEPADVRVAGARRPDPERGGLRILLIGGTYRALCVLERLLERGQRIVAFLGEEGSGDCDFCPEILEVCDRAGVPARSARKLGEDVVRWLEDRIRPDLAVSVGLRGEVPLSIGGNCRLGLLEVVAVHDGGSRPAIALRHQGREVARRELDAPKEDERAGQVFVRLTEEVLGLLEAHLAVLGRAHSRPPVRSAHAGPEPERAPCASAPAGSVEALEREAAARSGAARVLALASADEAAHCAARALGIGPGDEVIAPAFASPGAIRGLERSGARIVWADVEPDSLTLDPRSARERISPATRALLVSHGFGYSAPLGALAALAGEAGIALIEDCAGAPGVCGSGAGANPSLFELREAGGERDAAPALLSWPASGPAAPSAGAPPGAHALARLARALRESGESAAARARAAALYDRELWRYDAFRVRGARPGLAANFACYPLGVTAAARTSAEDLQRLLEELGIETALLPALASDRVLAELPGASRARESTLLLPLHAGLTDSLCAAVLDALYDYAIG